MYCFYAKMSASRPSWLDPEIKWMGNYEKTLENYWGARKFSGWQRGKKRTKNDAKYQAQLERILERESAAAEKLRDNKLKLLNQIDDIKQKISEMKRRPGDDLDEWLKELDNLEVLQSSLLAWKKSKSF